MKQLYIPLLGVLLCCMGTMGGMHVAEKILSEQDIKTLRSDFHPLAEFLLEVRSHGDPWIVVDHIQVFLSKNEMKSKDLEALKTVIAARADLVRQYQGDRLLKKEIAAGRFAIISLKTSLVHATEQYLKVIDTFAQKLR